MIDRAAPARLNGHPSGLDLTPPGAPAILADHRDLALKTRGRRRRRDPRDDRAVHDQRRGRGEAPASWRARPRAAHRPSGPREAGRARSARRRRCWMHSSIRDERMRDDPAGYESVLVDHRHVGRFDVGDVGHVDVRRRRRPHHGIERISRAQRKPADETASADRNPARLPRKRRARENRPRRGSPELPAPSTSATKPRPSGHSGTEPSPRVPPTPTSSPTGPARSSDRPGRGPSRPRRKPEPKPVRTAGRSPTARTRPDRRRRPPRR